jgi:hypothetical protein
MTDFTVENHGSVFLLQPHTPEATDWVTQNLNVEHWQKFGNAVAVEHRYIVDIVDGVQGDGLTVA